MASIWIKIPKNKPYTDNAVAPPQVYEGGELYEFDDQVPAELSAAQRILAARAGYDISNLVNQTNPLLISDGAVTAPAIAPGSDTDTGIFFPAVGQMAVAVAGALALTFSATAAKFETQVQIGDAVAASTSVGLVASGSSSYTPGVQVRNHDAAGWARLDIFHTSADDAAYMYQSSSGALYFRNDATTSIPFIWTVDGAQVLSINSSLTATFEGDVHLGMNQKLGIGTTPDQALHVHSTGNTFAKISSSWGGTPTCRFTFENENSDVGTGGFTFSRRGISQGALTFQHDLNAANQYLGMQTGNSIMRLYTNGRIAINKTTTPSTTFDVVGSAAFEASTPVLTLRSTNTTTGTSRLYFGDADADLRGGFFYNHSDDSLDIWTAGAVAMSIASNNNVTFEGGIGIGAAPSANHSLHVQRGDSNVLAKFERTGGNESSAWFASAGNNMYLTLKGLGTGKEVEILGMSTGALQLHTAGALAATFDTNQNMTLEGDLTGKGKIINTPVELTISAGAVTATCSAHAIGGEGNAADTLTTINGGVDGMILVLTGTGTGTEAITVSSAGNLNLNGGGSRTLTDAADTLTLQYRTAAGGWIELAYSNNGGLS